jgi:hypothetical protein
LGLTDTRRDIQRPFEPVPEQKLIRPHFAPAQIVCNLGWRGLRAKICEFYQAGNLRGVSERKGTSHTEEDWISDDAIAYESADNRAAQVRERPRVLYPECSPPQIFGGKRFQISILSAQLFSARENHWNLSFALLLFSSQ